MSFSYSLTQPYDASLIERRLLKVIKQGPIPNHCAIIMDGNRRFARQSLLGCLSTGYQMGYAVFSRSVRMFLDCGITEMTVYAFSQENYKRSKTEVETLMHIMLKGLQEFEKDIDYVNEAGICFEAIGKWESIPYPEIKELIARLMVKTKGNNKLKINMALGYSGREEIVDCAETIIQGLEDGLILPENMNEALVQQILTLKGTKPVDLLIRTSGVTRLSDFLLWSTNDYTYLEFIDVTWPEFKFEHFLKAISNYQQHLMSSKFKCAYASSFYNDRMIAFVKQFKAKRWEKIENLANI